MMRFFLFRLFHRHHWGLPRRAKDGELEVECFGCGRRRLLQVRLGSSAAPKV